MNWTGAGRSLPYEPHEIEEGFEPPHVVSRDQWLAARKELLAKEKELTRARDALNAERRMLPMVEIEKPYLFEGPKGEATLLDLFEGRRQLILIHFMSIPSGRTGARAARPAPTRWPRACSRTCRPARRRCLRRPRAAGQDRALQGQAGLDLPVLLDLGSDFNYDFHVTRRRVVAPVEYNYRTPKEHQQAARRTTSRAISRWSFPARATSCATASASSTRTRPSGAAAR